MRLTGFYLAILLLATGVSVTVQGAQPADSDHDGTDHKVQPIDPLPAARVKQASDRLIGFNLLLNTPPVPGIAMLDELGQPVTFDRFKGQVVLLNFWATWCPPCIHELPALDALQAKYAERGLIVVPVASGRTITPAVTCQLSS